MRPTKVILAALAGGGLLTLVGCAAPPSPANDPNRLIAPSAKIRKECAPLPTHLAQERCANPRILALYQAEANDEMDIATAYFARREAIAEKMDRGEITETEGRAEISEAMVVANTEVQRRSQTRFAVNATIRSTAPDMVAAPFQAFVPTPMTPNTLTSPPPPLPPTPIQDRCSMMDCRQPAPPPVQFVPYTPGGGNPSGYGLLNR